MFKSQEGFSNSMFGAYAYDPIIERNQDHPLVKMSKLIDWSFVEEEVSDRYSVMGQHAIHPLRIFKLLILQSYYNLSERDVMGHTEFNILARYFVGLGLTEEVPHWTELGKFKERIGNEAFERLFYSVLDQAEAHGITISNKRTADATDVRATVDLKRCGKDKKDDTDHTYVDRNTSDPDASFGRKDSMHKCWYGYKSHINQDAETELVTAVITTDASRTDESQLIGLILKERGHRGESAIRQQGGDKGYVGHTDELNEHHILDYVIPRDNMKMAKAQKDTNSHYLHLKRLRYKVEQKFGEGKNRHGLGNARHRGRWGVHVHSLLIYLTMNLKRIVTLLAPQTAR